MVPRVWEEKVSAIAVADKENIYIYKYKFDLMEKGK